MKLKSPKEYLIESNLDISYNNIINEDITDVIKTIINIKRIDNLGNKLKQLNIDKAKQQIILNDTKQPIEKDRTKKQISITNDKIDTIEDKIDTLVSNVNFMKTFVKQKGSISKQNAKLVGLEVLAQHYHDSDTEQRVKDLKLTLKQEVEQAEHDKQKMTDKQKQEVDQAKKGTVGDNPKTTDNPTQPDKKDDTSTSSDNTKTTDQEQPTKTVDKDQEEVEKENPHREELDKINDKITDLADKLKKDKNDVDNNIEYYQLLIKKQKLVKGKPEVISRMQKKLKDFELQKWNEDNPNKVTKDIKNKTATDNDKKTSDTNDEKITVKKEDNKLIGRKKEDSIENYKGAIKEFDVKIAELVNGIDNDTKEKEKEKIRQKVNNLRLQKLEHQMDLAELEKNKKEFSKYKDEHEKLKDKIIRDTIND